MRLMPRRCIMQKLLLIKFIMRRVLLSVLLTTISLTASMADGRPTHNSVANNQVANNYSANTNSASNPKLTTIKAMYNASSEQELGSEVLLADYSSEALKQALALERQMAETGMVCGSGGDIMWQSQDTDFQEPVTFAVDTEDRVVVQLSDRDTLSYVLTCVEERCLIEDIYDFGGSVKEMLLADCQ